MRNSNRYINGFKRLSGSLDSICKLYKKSKIYFYTNAFYSFIRYGVTPNQYIAYRFWEKSSLEKSRFYTARQQPRFERKLNNPKFADYFNKKELFNTMFSEFVKRDWLYCGDANESEIVKFLDTHEKVIVKPTSLSSGRGIHVYKEDSIGSLISDKFLLEEFVVQHHVLSALNFSSVNTIRIYTILDKFNQVNVLSASLRVD